MRQLMTIIRQLFERNVQEERELPAPTLVQEERVTPAPILSIEEEAKRILREFDEKGYAVPTVLMVLCSAYGQHLARNANMEEVQDLEHKFLELCVKERIYSQLRASNINKLH